MEAVGEHYRLAADIAIKGLGLEGCADTLVGNSMIRGISGGQRKRVTSGEMLVGPSNVLFADEISTGLDSATTFEICSRLRALCHLVSGTVLVSLLQPTPETYNTFDDIMLLSGGRLVFHGPREMIMPFFQDQGFACPLGKGDADFLQEVTTPGEQQVERAGKHVATQERWLTGLPPNSTVVSNCACLPLFLYCDADAAVLEGPRGVRLCHGGHVLRAVPRHRGGQRVPGVSCTAARAGDARPRTACGAQVSALGTRAGGAV
jgi:hypothetical protein